MATPIRPEEIIAEVPDHIIKTYNHFVRRYYLAQNGVAFFISVDEINEYLFNHDEDRNYDVFDVAKQYEKYGWNVSVDEVGIIFSKSKKN